MKKFIGIMFEGGDGSFDLNEVAAYHEASSLSDGKTEPPYGIFTTVILKSGVKMTIRGSLWDFRKDMEKYLKEENENIENLI
jgi:hypothetical protein